MSFKVKKGNAAAGGSATKAYTSKSSVTLMTSKLAKSAIKASNPSESKTNPSIIAKMREKVAAEKAGNAPAATSSQTFKPKPAFTSTASVSSFKTASSQVSTASASSFKSASSQVKASPSKHQSPLKNKGLKLMTDPGNKVRTTKVEEKPLSPMQTYEMSDREESESSEDESDDESRDKPKKAVSSSIY